MHVLVDSIAVMTCGSSPVSRWTILDSQLVSRRDIFVIRFEQQVLPWRHGKLQLPATSEFCTGY